MAKKYLSLEEAAGKLGLTPEALVKLREAGELRGFADRGTWKFLAATIEEYGRTLQAGSDPDIQMFETEDDTDEDVVMIGGDSIHDDDDSIDLSASDSDVRLMLDDSMAPDVGSTPDIALPGSESLSDVRLTGDDSDLKLKGSDSDVQLVGGADSDMLFDIGSDSDSDVAIVGSDSDSDVKVLDTESDLRLPSLAESSDILLPGTDSDIGLAATQFDDGDGGVFDSDSDVNLVSDTDGDLDLHSSDSDVALIVSDDGSAVTLEIDGEDMSDLENASSLILDPGDAGSGITLESSDSGIDFGAADSGISLESIGSDIGSGITLDADSGISLEAADSGISLEAADSGISLEAADSGISLESMDSGISLDAGSGISLEDADDSGIALDEDVSSTMPMQSLGTTDADFSDVDKTQEVSALGSSSEFELAGLDDDDEDVGSDTSVLLFDDDEFDDSDGTAAELAAVAAVGGAAAVAGASAIKDTSDEVDEFDDFDDDEDDDDGFDDFDDEDDDDELIGADDDDFEGDFEDDDDDVDFEKAPAAAGRGVSRGAEYEWGTWPFAGLCLSTLLMTACFLVGFDLIRSMWAHSEPAASGWLLNLVGGLFG